MQTRSRKSKGVRLQNWVRDILIDFFGLKAGDIKPAIMGESGADVIVHPSFKHLIPWSIECKNQEALKGIYKIYDQSLQHDQGEPLVIIKMNRRKPLAIMDAEYFFKYASTKN